MLIFLENLNTGNTDCAFWRHYVVTKQLRPFLGNVFDDWKENVKRCWDAIPENRPSSMGTCLLTKDILSML